MRESIKARALETANYILETEATVRQAARQFGVSRSTVHRDITDRLEQIDSTLAEDIRNLLDFHKDVRHIRDGIATKRKYRYGN
mgnify:CR=1 FL=1